MESSKLEGQALFSLPNTFPFLPIAEMAYVATPIVMVQSALTILQEADKLPER